MDEIFNENKIGDSIAFNPDSLQEISMLSVEKRTFELNILELTKKETSELQTSISQNSQDSLNPCFKRKP